MADQLVRWEIDGGSVIVETDEEIAGGWAPAGVSGERVVYQSAESLRKALHGVRDAARTALAAFRDFPEGPQEVEVEFGVKLAAEAGAIIAKTAMEGHLTVKLKWTDKTPDSGRG
ncbi:CU044_2847 family protein [Microbispora rosea]|uniref:CU044_2847 family protein n=1 Tax=Microbispora rosea TaxID=58117 RepID=UPI000563B857|nr:CU044_2847 family protein [Microbispora rosea]